MSRDKMPTLVLAGTIVVGALLLSGAPVSAIVLPLVLLACPLMMIFMMRGMSQDGGHGAGCHGGHAGHQPTEQHDGQQDPSTRPGEDSRR